MLIIIIVDDDAATYYFIEKAVREARPCITFHADSSRNFFRLIRKVVPDFIFLKEKMPGPDPWYCLKKLRVTRKYNLTPIVVYAAGVGCKTDAYKLGANLHLTLPVSPADLSISIHSILAFNWKTNFHAAAESFCY